MNQGQTETVEWFVVFTRSELKTWVMRLLNPDFRHVYAMKKSEGGQFWMVVNPLRSHTHVTLELVDNYPHPRLYSGEDAVIVPIRTKIDKMNNRHTLCVFNCVEVVKSLLGIKSFWTWTPYQLYKKLMRCSHV